MNDSNIGGIILNDDFAHFYGSRHRNNIEISKNSVREYIDQYIDTQVKMFCININASLSYTPSKVMETVFDKYLQNKEEFEDTHVKLAYETYVKNKIDITQIMVEELHHINIEPWISIRMNDLHGSKDKMDARTSDFRQYAINNQLCRTTHRPFSDYYDFCFDYSNEEIRNRMIQYIKEQLIQYDMDGIELDFLRELYCFKVGNEAKGREIINDMIREIKNFTSNLSKKRNKNIKIMVRVPSNPIYTYDFGFDIYTWANEKLVDYLIVTPRFTTCDSTIAIDSWVRMFEHVKMEIVGGIEILTHPKADQFDLSFVNTPEMANGYACQYLSDGSQKVYLYNYFDDPVLEGDPSIDTMSFSNQEINCNDIRGACTQAKRFYKPFLQTVGSLSTCKVLPRRHILTYNDIAPQWVAKKAKLPFLLEKEDYTSITVSENYAAINTGNIPEQSDVYLLVGINEKHKGGDVTIWCNNIICEFVRTTTIYPHMTNSTVYAFRIPYKALNKNKQVFEFATKLENMVVDYMEVRIFNK